ncbi:MAG: QueT transporter family protein [Candidatus Bathyarchaeia archaeon]
MKSKSSIFVTLTAVFAAVYAVGVVALAQISFLPFQVRVADALLPLAMVFGWPAVVGLSIGAFVANFFGGLGPVDIVGGAFANFLATFAAWRIAHNKSKSWGMVGVIVEILVVTLIVGSYLSYLFAIPLEASWAEVMFGSIIAIGILGSILYFAIKERAAALLRPYGLAQSDTTSKKR